jgi:GT2 family glycosyltransferase
MTERLVQTGVVAIGRNEGERLVRCLRSLQGTSCPVVYVDSASTDRSVKRAAELGAQVVPLDTSKPFTAARARAAGFAALEASHPSLAYMFFVDGDCEVEPDFLETAEQFLDSHPDVAVVCGRRRERYPEATPFNRLIDREWTTPVGEATACGGDALYRRQAYCAVGGFDPRMLAGEEPELCARLRMAGWRIMRLDVAMTVHDAAMTRLGQWWRRAIRSGMGYAQAWAATRRRSRPPLYQREILRAALWAGALPLMSLGLAFALHWALILIWPGAATLQGLRLACRGGSFGAWLSVIGKYAELIGILRYLQRVLRGSAGSTVLYK